MATREERKFRLILFVEAAYFENNHISEQIESNKNEIERFTQMNRDLALKKMDAIERVKKAEREYQKFMEGENE
jgi:hypothetical protein